MYSKLKCNITNGQSEAYDMSSRKKYRETFTMTLCQHLVIRKLSHKNNSNVFKKNLFYFFSCQCFVPHGIKSSPSPHSTSTILLPLFCSVLLFALYFPFTFASHSFPSPFLTVFYWGPKLFSGANDISLSHTIFVAYRVIFQDYHIPIIKLKAYNTIQQF